MVYCSDTRCSKPFHISGDLVSAAYEMLIFDCYDLKEEKKYGYCIRNLAQAWESFFSLYLRVSLLYRPFARSDFEELKHSPYALT